MIDLADPDPLVFLLITVLGLALLAAYRVKDSVIAFFAAAYPNARYSAMGNEFVTRAGTGRLVTARTLQDAVGAASSRNLSFRESDMDTLDRELDGTLTSTIEMVRSEMPPPAAPIFDMILLGHELRILRRILKAKHHGLSWQADPVGSLDRRTLQLLRDSSDHEDLRYILRFTPYGGVIERLYAGGVPDPAAVDRSLDDFFLHRFRETIQGIRIWKGAYLDYLRVYSDITNLRLALRIRETGAEFDPEGFLRTGTTIGSWELEQMARADTLAEAIRHLQGSAYAITAETIHEAERELDRTLLRHTAHLARSYINTAGPSLHFVQCREFEIRNLRRIFRGITEGLPAREIERELVLVD